MKDFVKAMVEAIVDHPDKVEVNEKKGNQTIVYEVRVAKEDVGKVIGINGRTANSIRTLLNAACMKSRKRAVLDILE
jgi:uncharacterized protein